MPRYTPKSSHPEPVIARTSRPQLHVPKPSKAQVIRAVGQFGLLTIGSLMMVFGFSTFMAPFDIAGGGAGGIALVTNHWIGLAPGLTMLTVNAPIMVLGYKQLGGKRFLARTLFVVVIYNVGVDVLAQAFNAELTDDLLLVSLFGGVIMGLGGGLVFRGQGTPGGTGVISRIIQIRTGVPVSQIYLALDGIVIGAQAVAFGWEKALYSIIFLFVAGLATDYVLEGPSVVRTVTVVTDKPELLAETVFSTMRVGVTGWEATGMYSHTDHHILFCTVSRAEARRLVEAIQLADPDAFTVIGNAHQRRGGLVKGGTP